jgi:hypothetical protein
MKQKLFSRNNQITERVAGTPYEQAGAEGPPDVFIYCDLSCAPTRIRVVPSVDPEHRPRLATTFVDRTCQLRVRGQLTVHRDLPV